MEKKKIIAVVGPTASGKTSLAVEIAKRFDGEVVSADSMQIYKGMDIASAKPSEVEKQGIVHHLISVKDVSERYSVAVFCEDAKKICDEIISRGKLPILCGGTGLYIDSFINNIEFIDESFDSSIRDELNKRLKNEGNQVLYNELNAIDPDYAKKIEPNNSKRVIRALELYLNTGTKMSEQICKSKQNESEFDAIYIGIKFDDRNNLYDRINKRVDKMVENGLLNEAEDFLKINDVKTANQAIGIKELKPYFDGIISLEQAIDKIKQETRRYAKRQLTWFNRNEKINWIYADKTESIIDDAFGLIEKFLRGN